MKVCQVCGTENKEDVQFCTDCGADLSAVEKTIDQPEPEADAPVEAAAEEHAEAVEESAEASAEASGAADASEETEASGDTTDVIEELPVEEEDIVGPYLVVVSTGDKIPLTSSEIVIGREDPISNIFPDVDTTPFGGLEGGVSRKHAKITESGGTYHIEDLNSTNYTLVNKEKLDPSNPRQLTAGDEIRFGRIALLFMM